VEGQNPARNWNTEINKNAVQVPKGLRLVMCDVDCGSETVGMVKTVLSWRKNKPEEAALLWGALQKGNEELAEELRALTKESESTTNDYQNLRNIILTIRSLIREMSDKAGVPIEPKSQTHLIDACSKIPGVIGGVVPGAGGYDAIALLLEDREDVMKELNDFLSRYKVEITDGESGSIGKVRLLGVKQEMEGVKTEDRTIYEDWLQ